MTGCQGHSRRSHSQIDEQRDAVAAAAEAKNYGFGHNLPMVGKTQHRKRINP